MSALRASVKRALGSLLKVKLLACLRHLRASYPPYCCPVREYDVNEKLLSRQYDVLSVWRLVNYGINKLTCLHQWRHQMYSGISKRGVKESPHMIRNIASVKRWHSMYITRTDTMHGTIRRAFVLTHFRSSDACTKTLQAGNVNPVLKTGASMAHSVSALP